MEIQIKRIYEPSSPGDGYRILVDRLWPRGKRKEDVHIDEWMKEIAPSTELRKWFHADMGSFEDFSRRYKSELEDKTDLLEYIRSIAIERKVTLLYGVKDEAHNHARLLREVVVKLDGN